MKTFVAKNTRFAERLEKISNEVLKDIKPGKRHHSIPIISNTLDVSSVFGMTFVEFGMLYTFLTGDLLRLPHCPMELGPSDSSPEALYGFIPAEMGMFLPTHGSFIRLVSQCV